MGSGKKYITPILIEAMIPADMNRNSSVAYPSTTAYKNPEKNYEPKSWNPQKIP
jgi:hypothetical protein